ncbi:MULTISPECIES: CAP-associated domain-containing protein [Sporosarcina]|uniref:CAP domain-containing protein n=1 Tax=Sporosarcina contaminans TaxID=633403 RepID=A0ABW3TX38_9BACL
MKVLWKIVVLVVILLFLFYLMDSRVKENEPLESPVKQGTAIPSELKDDFQTTAPVRPEKGLSTYVGKKSESVIADLGEPDRIEPSAYGYDWWQYSSNGYLLIGVQDGIINQVYSSSEHSDMSPFKIGQNVEEIFRFSIIESEVNVPIGENSYSFSLNSEDMMNRILIKYEDLYAQIYVDGKDQIIEGIRFLDAETLVVHQPYAMEYTGEMIPIQQPSSTLQMEVDRSMERQIVELTNEYREHHEISKLQTDYWLTSVAQNHSKDMALENYFSHESPSAGNLSERLKEAKIEHKKAGENIASEYVDAIEAVHGWLNSPAHRDVLLEESFTHIGTGAYGKFYTQVLIRANKEEQNQFNQES